MSALSSASVVVAVLAFLASLSCATVGAAWQIHQRGHATAAPGTVLAARSDSENTQDLVVGVTARHGRRPAAVVRFKLRQVRLAEGQQVRVAVRPDGRVRLGVGPGRATLSRATLAYLGAAQLAVIGALVLVVQV